MQRASIQRIIGLLLMIFSLSMLTPVIIDLLYLEGEWEPFVAAFGLTLGFGLAIWLPVRRVRDELRLRDGFVVVTALWTVLGLFGALPFMLADHPHLPVADAVFESVSGLTSAGGTVITANIDQLPHAILYYRQQLQWLGGMGIIVLAVAILPMLGIGGMQLFRAETPGPMKDDKLTPRITETAKALWYIYLILTLGCTLFYWLAGMDLFDAVGHSFATVSLGGFSTHGASMGYFTDPMIWWVGTVFMVLAGMNFALHFLAWRHMSIKPYLHDTEVRVFISVLVLACGLVVWQLYINNVFPDLISCIHHGVFQTVSLFTTTGLVTTNYAAWPTFVPVLLMLVSVIGACAGSTSGGIKVIRFYLLYKQGAREITRLFHPNAHIPVRVGGKVIPDRVVESVWGFFSLYVACFVIMMLLLMATGQDLITAFSAIAACLNNMGAGLGEVSSNFGGMTDFAKWVCSFAMILGRLEIFTVLVLLTPAFWRS